MQRAKTAFQGQLKARIKIEMKVVAITFIRCATRQRLLRLLQLQRWLSRPMFGRTEMLLRRR